MPLIQICSFMSIQSSCQMVLLLSMIFPFHLGSFGGNLFSSVNIFWKCGIRRKLLIYVIRSNNPSPWSPSVWLSVLLLTFMEHFRTFIYFVHRIFLEVPLFSYLFSCIRMCHIYLLILYVCFPWALVSVGSWLFLLLPFLPLPLICIISFSELLEMLYREG